MTKMKLYPRLLRKIQVHQQISICVCRGDSWAAPYLVLLLEAIALGALHLGDVLEEVRHADRWVQLTCLVRHVDRLPFPQGVSVRLHKAAGVTAHVLALVCGAQRQGQARAGQHGGAGTSRYRKIHMGDIMLKAVNVSDVFCFFLILLTCTAELLGVNTPVHISLITVPINRWHIISFTGKHYVTSLQIDKQLSTSNLFVMDGHNNTTSLSNRMSHVVGRFRSICLSVWLENI